jgi:hypothetical protein
MTAITRLIISFVMRLIGFLPMINRVRIARY